MTWVPSPWPCGFSVRLFARLRAFLAAVTIAATQLATAVIQAATATADGAATVHNSDAHAGNDQQDYQETQYQSGYNSCHQFLSSDLCHQAEDIVNYVAKSVSKGSFKDNVCAQCHLLKNSQYETEETIVLDLIISVER